MIDIYIQKKESKDWILQNDLYFNLNTANEEMSENEIKIIQQVDEAKLTPDKHIETKYGLGTIRNLSSGCKTLLNIVKHPDKVACGVKSMKGEKQMIYKNITFKADPFSYDLMFDDRITLVGGDNGTGKTVMYEILEDLRLTDEYKAIKLFNYKSDNLLEAIKQCRDNFIVIDNADILIDDVIRRFINFEFSNQYMLFLRNCDGLNVSDKSFKVLKLEDNRITLEEEL